MNAPGERSQGRMKSKLAAKVVAGVTLAGALLVGMAAPAFADSVTIRKVDTTKFPQVVLSVLATGGSPTPADFHLRENGKIIESWSEWDNFGLARQLGAAPPEGSTAEKLGLGLQRLMAQRMRKKNQA